MKITKKAFADILEKRLVDRKKIAQWNSNFGFIIKGLLWYLLSSEKEKRIYLKAKNLVHVKLITKWVEYTYKKKVTYFID